MEFPSNVQHNKTKTSTSEHKKSHIPSKSELMASAKVVADVAMNHGENKYNKAEIAGAASTILNAASHYGKLEDKSFGKLVGKAEEILKNYHTSHSTTTTNSAHSATTTTTTGTTHSPDHRPGKGNHDQGHNSSGSKYGEYIKMAEEVLKKHSGNKPNDDAHTGDEQGHSGGHDYGQYMKMAGDFLKKH